MSIGKPQCISCKHKDPRGVNGGRPTCAAFPEGMAQVILIGAFDHTKPCPNKKNPLDNDIRYKKAE